MTDPTTPGDRALLGDNDLTDLRRRWIEVEEWFVDDPGDAVRRADDLVDDFIDRIRAVLAERREDLRSRWETLDDATTEQLRAVLHHYQQMFEQLTELRAPDGWAVRERGARPTAHGRPTFPDTGQRTSDGDTTRQSDNDMGARS